MPARAVQPFLEAEARGGTVRRQEREIGLNSVAIPLRNYRPAATSRKRTTGAG